MNKIVFYPNKTLRKSSKEIENINDDVINCINMMKNSLYENGGIGLAGIQIGVPLRIVLVDCAIGKNDLKVLINPKIIEKSKEMIPSKEGCLSIPGIYEEVQRYKEVLVESLSPTGKRQSIEGSALLSCCLQHEIEHLDGILFIDKIEGNIKQNMIKSKAKKISKMFML